MGKVFETDSIKVMGEELSYQYFYYGGDTTIIAVHGACECGRVFDLLAEKINCNVITLDLPGHGKSKGELKNHVKEFSKSVYEFSKGIKKRYNIKNIILMGHSMGGIISLDIASDEEKGSIFSKFIPIAGALCCDFMPHNIPEIVKDPVALANMVAGEVNKCSEFEKEYILRNLPSYFNSLPDAPFKDFSCCVEYDNLKAAKDIKKPVLLITGDEDGVIPPKCSIELKSMVKTASLLVVPNSKHLVLVELSKVGIIGEAINSFL